ncbi:DUF806 family protein [Lactobacillus crispatus]|jgi:hypothetical protein|uniref:DUF806 family protein n=1 Tax=Lactobacillus crispatus TaxID=47770 RepID=UPI000761C0F5|nr:DUF806 family protein [Lactobacillus crispatus]MBI1716732.1 hypothetical protein [Lactobacillus crispatus]MCT7828638.1 DUF806 family protein [Lactobacillus crispatus]MDK7331436.1 DUF806 family protein [Lactobacillus crispatus]MDK8154198.1 DUF806 family protein [Lactobacillus crispatus]NJJ53465.1 DUF806 family protein [Lactobacillus crispatus]
MSTLAKEVADELQNSGIKDIGIVSSYTLPSTGGIADKQNNILVTEVTTVPNEYGSNQFTQTDETIELNIYYGTQKTVPIDTFERSIVSFFMQRNWSLLPYGGHYKDPTTKQLCIDFQFRRRKTWKFKD